MDEFKYSVPKDCNVEALTDDLMACCKKQGIHVVSVAPEYYRPRDEDDGGQQGYLITGFKLVFVKW